ncbi:hypothetical protein GOP47_0030574 [Adiantum capillus-veneris]|nr:hypothetical protein GOP47_0030574 [Adiantum capillus-veneris]
MDRNLKREHGLAIHIPVRKSGRASQAELPSRAKAPRSRVEKVECQKLAKKRFEDKERKFAINV